MRFATPGRAVPCWTGRSETAFSFFRWRTEDGGSDRRDVPKPTLESGSGRGLTIVESIADRVVYEKGGRKILVEMTL